MTRITMSAARGLAAIALANGSCLGPVIDRTEYLTSGNGVFGGHDLLWTTWSGGTWPANPISCEVVGHEHRA